MRVFVWVSYGDSNVYRADTADDLDRLWTELRGVFEYEYEGDDRIPRLDALLQYEKPGNLEKFIRLVSEIVSEMEQDSDCESFNWGSGFTELK